MIYTRVHQNATLVSVVSSSWEQRVPANPGSTCFWGVLVRKRCHW